MEEAGLMPTAMLPPTPTTPSGWSMTLSSWPSTELSNEARFMAKAVARPELTASRPSVALLT